MAADVLTSDNMKNQQERISVAIKVLKEQFLFELDTVLKYQKKLKRSMKQQKKVDCFKWALNCFKRMQDQVNRIDLAAIVSGPACNAWC